jgi:hypothetical protein
VDFAVNLVPRSLFAGLWIQIRISSILAESGSGTTKSLNPDPRRIHNRTSENKFFQSFRNQILKSLILEVIESRSNPDPLRMQIPSGCGSTPDSGSGYRSGSGSTTLLLDATSDMAKVRRKK